MNAGFSYRERVGREAAGRTVLAHLAAAWTHSSSAEWRARIEAGEVEVEGRRAGVEDLLRPGMRVVWHRPPWEEPDAPLAFAILHRDDHLLAVAKPGGLPTLPGAGFLEHTLLHQVRLRDPGASPVHRLGRGTSGLVLFARRAAAAEALRASWHRVVEKTYRALVQGRPRDDVFAVETPIGLVPHAALGRLHAASPEGKASESHVRVLERRGDETLVEVRIVTGRPHQIRIHLAAAGHPLSGDPLYLPGGHARPEARPGELGYLLHAARLRLEHPGSGAVLELACRPPPELRGAKDGETG